MGKNRSLMIGLVVIFVGLQLVSWLVYRQRYNSVAQELSALQTSVAGGGNPASASGAEPFTIAFVSDTETLSRWDEVLQFIADEGAQMLIHQGDYIDGINPQTLEEPTWDDLLSEELKDASGNPTGDFNCNRELQGLRCILGGDFPVLGSAVGKELPEPLVDYYLVNLTRIEEQGGRWGGCVAKGDPGEPGVRMSGCLAGDNLYDSRSADYWVRWRGITMVFQNSQPDTTWVPQVLENDTNIWKLCMWHGNHIDFQTGDKGHAYDGEDHALPYEMYRNCADAGAIVINGNEHNYSRTCVMQDIGNFNNDGPSYPNRVNREPGTQLENHGAICPNAGASNEVAMDTVEQLEIGPGKTMVLVSALPGYAWREYLAEVPSLMEQDLYRHDNDGWWATIFARNRYCRNNCTTADLSAQNPDAFVIGMNPPVKIEEPADAPWDPYSDGHGVLFITFNYNGDPYKAHGYFKKLFPDPDTGRQIVDEFVITYKP